MYQTKNDLPEKTRRAVAAILDARLADSVDLMQQAKQAHWNVRGANFIALHKLFDEIADAAAEYTDLVAERAVALAAIAHGTVQAAAKESKLPAYPRDIADARAHLEALASALAAYAAGVRHAIEETDRQGDKATADVFTEIARGADKYLWLVEAHLG